MGKNTEVMARRTLDRISMDGRKPDAVPDNGRMILKAFLRSLRLSPLFQVLSARLLKAASCGPEAQGSCST